MELSEAADADLVEILSYGTEAFGEERAEAYVESFKENSDLISMHPLAGAVHDEVRPPIRSLPHGSHRLSTTFSTMRSSSSESCTRRWMCCGIFEGSR